MNIDTLKLYAENKLNVLMTGKHGVGKTAVIKKVFTELYGPINVGWMYFSASTLDPWVDLIGIPKNFTDASGDEVFKIIPPSHFTGKENVKAIFFDELNRADDKTLNAVMELIQFKSINGRKFENLQCVWAAENPHDDDNNDYMVRQLDPAQRDRFQIQLSVPYVLDEEYFAGKFGENITNLARNWWNVPAVKNKISPRKLDDMLSGFVSGFDISDFTNIISVDDLKVALSSVGTLKIIKDIAGGGNVDAIKKFFTLDNIRKNEVIIKSDRKNGDIFDAVYPHVDGEIKSYISTTFKYTYVANRSPNVLNNNQINYLLSTTGEKTPMVFENARVIFDKMTKIDELFTFSQIQDDLISDISDLDKLFPFEFSADAWSNTNSSSLMRQYIDNVDNGVDKDKICRYVALVSAVASRIGQISGDVDTADNIISFIDNAIDNAFGYHGIGVSAINKRDILNAIRDNVEIDNKLLEDLKYNG